MLGGHSSPTNSEKLLDREQGRASSTHLEPGGASSPLWPLPHGAKPLPAGPWHPLTSAGLGYWLCQNSVFPGQDRGRRTCPLVRSPLMWRVTKTVHSTVMPAKFHMCYTEEPFWSIPWPKLCKQKWGSLCRRQRSFPCEMIISIPTNGLCIWIQKWEKLMMPPWPKQRGWVRRQNCNWEIRAGIKLCHSRLTLYSKHNTQMKSRSKILLSCVDGRSAIHFLMRLWSAFFMIQRKQIMRLRVVSAFSMLYCL